MAASSKSALKKEALKRGFSGIGKPKASKSGGGANLGAPFGNPAAKPGQQNPGTFTTGGNPQVDQEFAALPAALRNEYTQYFRTQWAAGGKALTPAAWQKSVHPETTGATYNPGVRNPTVDPFMTSDQMVNHNDQYKSLTDTINNNAARLVNAMGDTAYNKAQIAQQRTAATASTQWAAAARGMAQSSVRDSDLWDINRTAQARQQNLDTQLETLRTTIDTLNREALSRWERWSGVIGQEMVQNAENANANVPVWQTQPGWTPAPELKPMQPETLVPGTPTQVASAQAPTPPNPADLQKIIDRVKNANGGQLPYADTGQSKLVAAKQYLATTGKPPGISIPSPKRPPGLKSPR